MSPHRPRPITVQNSWLNKSLEDRVKILQTVAPDRAEGLSLIVNAAVEEEWETIGHTPKGTGGDR